MGDPITAPTYIYGDNISITHNPPKPELALKKKSNTIACHALCESVAMSESLRGHMRSEDNLANFLTKINTKEKRKHLVSQHFIQLASYPKLANLFCSYPISIHEYMIERTRKLWHCTVCIWRKQVRYFQKTRKACVHWMTTGDGCIRGSTYGSMQHQNSGWYKWTTGKNDIFGWLFICSICLNNTSQTQGSFLNVWELWEIAELFWPVFFEEEVLNHMHAEMAFLYIDKERCGHWLDLK